MTNPEFSTEFDLLYNNISSNQAPGLNEYEKSVFLTTAQDALVLEFINGNNPSRNSFEKTEEVRQYLSDIVKTAKLSEIEDSNIIKIADNSHLYEIPEDLWFITHESVKYDESKLPCSLNSNTEIIPVTQDAYTRISKNPFRRASVNRVLRLNVSGKIELVSKYDIESYIIRYIAKLDPIILEDLPYGLTIKDHYETIECKLNPALHKAILERAVLLAKASMGLIETGR